MDFDPLLKVEEFKNKGRIPLKIYQRIKYRFPLASDGIKRIETACNIKYPDYYIEPSLIVSRSEIEPDHFGIFFARTIPAIMKSAKLNVIIQITAPLIAYGSVGTIHAILAHEFIHYLDLLNKIMNMNIISDEVSNTLFEERYLDNGRTLDARIVFKRDRGLINHIANRFPEGFKDSRLEERVISDWIKRALPTIQIPIHSNATKIPIELISELNIDQIVREKILEFENLRVKSIQKKSRF
jgi:hypothetical protein